jgi:thiol-disulfide isomerase/thioredoxin
MGPLRVLGVVVAVVAGVVALAVFGPSSTRGERRAPALPSERLSGARTTLGDLLGGARGRPVAVVFFASWCEPCAREAPDLQRFAQSASGHGRIVAVDWDDARSNGQSFIRHYDWTFPTVRDGVGSVGYSYHLATLPTTFVVDSAGRISATLHGPQTTRDLERALG